MKRVLAFGEAMLRLAAPGGSRLEQARRFDVSVGGAELNFAAGLAALGDRASFVTALPDNPPGRLAAAEVRRAGVDGSRIIWSKRGRMGLYYLEFGASPRASKVLYDRSASAVSLLKPGDIDWERSLDGFDHLHVTGITPALGQGCRKLVAEGLEAAGRRGVTTSFDLNYRARLWTEANARKSLSPMMEHVDHLITTEEDTWRVFRIKGSDYREVALALLERFGFRSVAVTLREDVSVLRNRWTAIARDRGRLYEDKVYDVEIIDRVGSGDAFAAGYVYGALRGDLALGLRMGNAMAALKHTVPGDMPVCDLSEVEALARSEAPSLRIER